MRKVLLPILLASVMLTPEIAVAQGTIRVYVGQAGEESGFGTKGADDSVLDLTKALRGKRRLTVVNSKAEADLLVLVESRDSHVEAGGVATYKDSKGHTQAYTTYRKERAVYATLRVDEYRHQMHGEGVTWTQASERVAGDVDKWVEQNLVRLIERRLQR